MERGGGWRGGKKTGILGGSFSGWGGHQGGIVSPLLSNLILHEFDEYMDKLISDRNSMVEKKDIRNPIYVKLTSRITTLRRKLCAV